MDADRQAATAIWERPGASGKQKKKYIHTYTQTYIHKYMHTYRHTYIHYIHTHTYIHTYIMHAYTHTYIHTYMHTEHSTTYARSAVVVLSRFALRMGSCSGILNGAEVWVDAATGAPHYLRDPVHLLGHRRPRGGRAGVVVLPHARREPAATRTLDEMFDAVFVPAGDSKTLVEDLMDPNSAAQLLPHELDPCCVSPIVQPCTPTLLDTPSPSCSRFRSPRR